MGFDRLTIVSNFSSKERALPPPPLLPFRNGRIESYDVCYPRLFSLSELESSDELLTYPRAKKSFDVKNFLFFFFFFFAASNGIVIKRVNCGKCIYEAENRGI